MQQLPNYSDENLSIRSLFLPEEGCEWGCFDYSQQEPRLVLHFAAKTGLSGVGNTLEKYQEGSFALPIP